MGSYASMARSCSPGERGREFLGEPFRPLGVAVHADRFGGEGDSRAVSRLDRAFEHHLEHA